MEDRTHMTWNRIWDELDQTKTTQESLLWYTDRARKRNRRLNRIILVCAIIGAVVFKWFPISAFIATVIITVLELLKNYSSSLCQSEEELSILDKQITFYSLYLNDIERICSDFNDKHITEQKAGKAYYKCKQREAEHISIVNKYVRNIPTSVEKIIHERTDSYLKTLSYQNQESNETK